MDQDKYFVCDEHGQIPIHLPSLPGFGLQGLQGVPEARTDSEEPSLLKIQTWVLSSKNIKNTGLTEVKKR